MAPTLQINDVVLVKITKENLNKGDIIAFYGENAIITHRILFMENDIITVKGDSNSVVDKPISKEQVIGKIVKVFPKLGIWKKVITNPKILLAIFITLLLFDFALSYSDKNKHIEVKAEVKADVKEEKKEEIIATQIMPEEKKEVKKKVIEPEELLEFTRKIDIDEINRLLEGTEYKLEKKEINNLKKEIAKVDGKKNNNVAPKLSKKEKKFVEYTLRLDLNEIQKNISKNTK